MQTIQTENSEVIDINRSHISSKFPSHRSKNEFYRYYAGYPLKFAEWALSELGLPPKASIIDPWSGSGTTAAACAQARMSCQGYDINPVMVHLGRARVALKTDFDEAENLIIAVEQTFIGCKSIDLASIGAVLYAAPAINESTHSIAVAALFPYARSLLQTEKTKNPSWYKKSAKLDQSSVIKKDFFSSWRTLLRELQAWQESQDDRRDVAVSVERGDSRQPLGHEDSFDGFLTSPPYLTRLDYVQATLPELLLLQAFDEATDMQQLRRSMLGSPLTSKDPTHGIDLLPDIVSVLLERIQSHQSKASATYYYRFFASYFVDLHKSMRNIEKVLKDGAVGCMVVQSSHYKEIEIDLSSVVIALGKEIGLQSYSTAKFTNRRSMSLVNTRAHVDARKPKGEFAIFLRKG